MPRTIAINAETMADVAAAIGIDAEPSQPEPQHNGHYTGQPFDVRAFLARHTINVKCETPHNGGHKLLLECCPFNPEHKAPDAAIFIGGDGALGFKCFHNSCSGHGWRELRDKLEPRATRRSERATKEQAKDDSPAMPVLTCLADVEPRPVAWLWPGRIPAGRITLLVGRPGEGKSFLTIDAAARVTTGTPWPDGEPCPSGSVILISAEDDPGDTIRPRLDAHYADCRKVHLLSAVRRRDGETEYERIITLADVAAIEQALKRHPDCKLLVVDPIGSFLGGGTDAHRDNEVRSVLAPIDRLAKQYGPAVVVVAHRRKSSGGTADESALGSRAFTGIARATWHLSRDVENKARRLFLPGKNNLAPEGDGLALSIIGEPARVAWEREPVTINADEALAAENSDGKEKPGPEPEARTQAAAWLRELLAGGRVEAATVKAEGEAAGYAWRTLHRAKDELGIVPCRERFGGPWLWALPTVPSDSQRENNLASWHDSENTEENANSEPGTIATCQVDLSWHDRTAEGADATAAAADAEQWGDV